MLFVLAAVLVDRDVARVDAWVTAHEFAVLLYGFLTFIKRLNVVLFSFHGLRSNGFLVVFDKPQKPSE